MDAVAVDTWEATELTLTEGMAAAELRVGTGDELDPDALEAGEAPGFPL